YPSHALVLQEDAYYVSSIEGLAETITHFYDQPVDALMRAAHGAERVRKAYSFEQASVRLWAALHQALKRSLAIRLRVEPGEWRSIYDAEHKRNWAYSLERFDPDWGRHWRARFVRQYTEGPDVLDLAAGGGVYTVLLARDGHRVTWSDISPVAMEQARIQAEKHGVSHMIDDYLVGDCRTMVTSKQYDTVWMGEVLEHLPDPDVALKNALGMVKPGGKLILTVPLGEHHFDPMHLHVWSRESFKSELLNTVIIPAKGYSVELLDEIAEEGADPSCLIAIIRRSPEEAK
ncbi:MAG: methyltransferase domain-containing protein, partial [Sphaerochaeta sp.]|nr:methyltransferase domain-containing protein [Sphaerochaeta sp.]